MSGLNTYDSKQRREVRRRNHVAKDLLTPKYAPRVREVKKHHMIDELHEQDANDDLYWFFKELGLSNKE